MPRMNFRDVQAKYFGHVDAKLVGYKITSDDEGSFYSARYYPFWDHPLYSKDKSNFFNYPEEAQVVFTVYPINLIRANEIKSPEIIHDAAWIEGKEYTGFLKPDA